MADDSGNLKRGNFIQALETIRREAEGLTDDNVGTPKWRLKVEIKLGEDPALDLGPDNSINTRDDFPKKST